MENTVSIKTDYLVIRRVPLTIKVLPDNPLTDKEIKFLDKTIRKQCMNNYSKILRSFLSDGECMGDLRQEGYYLYIHCLKKFCKDKIKATNKNQPYSQLLLKKFQTFFNHEAYRVFGRTTECISGVRYEDSKNVRGQAGTLTLVESTYESMTSEASDRKHIELASSRFLNRVRLLSPIAQTLITECFDLEKPTKHTDICYQVERWFINRGYKNAVKIKTLQELSDFLTSVKDDIHALVDLDYHNWAEELLSRKNDSIKKVA